MIEINLCVKCVTPKCKIREKGVENCSNFHAFYKKEFQSTLEFFKN